MDPKDILSTIQTAIAPVVLTPRVGLLALAALDLTLKPPPA